MISIKGLSKQYGSKEILKDINLDIPENNITGIIGPSGSGKTTLLRLLNLLDKPTDGTILINGTDTRSNSKLIDSFRKNMVMVFQKPALFNASIFDNVAYGLKIRGTTKKEIHNKVNNALEMVDLPNYGNLSVEGVSDGEAKRISIAQAIVIDPELLLLDEPTSSLDPISSKSIENLFSTLMADGQKTIVMTTHDMAQGQRLAQHMGVLIDGSLLQKGTSHEIFSMPNSKSVAQFLETDNMLEGIIKYQQGGLATIDTGKGLVQGISELPEGSPVYACIRPDNITLTTTESVNSARNTLTGIVTNLHITGPLARVIIDCGVEIASVITTESAEELGIRVNRRVQANFKASGVHIFSSQNIN